MRPVTELLGTADFKLIPHKLLIYEKGGHFDVHVDGQHSENQVASLLLHLPIPFVTRVGKLVVKNNGREEIVDFSGRSKFCYVAFFTDCPHKVQPVTEGTRIMMPYDVVMTSPLRSLVPLYQGTFFSKLDYTGRSLTERGAGWDKEKLEQLVSAIASEVKAKGQIALMLKHRYSVIECAIFLVY